MLTSIWNRIRDLRFFMYFFLLSFYLIQPKNENLWIMKLARKCSWQNNLYPPITYEKKFRTHEIATRKNFVPTKYPWEEISDPRSTHHGARSTRPIMARDPRDLSHLIKTRDISLIFLKWVCSLKLRLCSIYVILENKLKTYAPFPEDLFIDNTIFYFHGGVGVRSVPNWYSELTLLAIP